MVKIRCPVCGGSGGVSREFGVGGVSQMWYPYYNITPVPSGSYTYSGTKQCPACLGTGMQECDCARLDRFDKQNPYIPATVDPNPYVPSVASYTYKYTYENRS